MSAKKETLINAICLSVRTGAISVGITLLLLLPASFMIWKGTVGEDSIAWLTAACAFLAGFAASFSCGRIKEQKILSVFISVVFASFLLLLISTGIRGSRIGIAGLLPNSAAIAAGIGINSFMQNNKSDRKRKKR